jgi:putative SOS response-associated peptidase YedK
MARWVDRVTGEHVTSCAVLTTAATRQLATLHERMPVVLPDEVHGAWVDAAVTDAGNALALARAAAASAVDRMEHYAVSPRVNDARVDEPQLLEPVPAAAS